MADESSKKVMCTFYSGAMIFMYSKITSSFIICQLNDYNNHQKSILTSQSHSGGGGGFLREGSTVY